MRKFFVLLCALLVLSFAGFANAQQENSICVYFFYGTGCPYCADAEAHLETLEEKYPQLEIHKLNIMENIDLINNLYEEYGVPIEEWGAVPILFIGDKYYLAADTIINNIEAEILKYEDSGVVCPGGEDADGTPVSILQLAGLAAVDAVNPCTLAVLVILMTAILTRFPDRKRKVLKAGFAFTFAVFLMYFIFGLLIISGFKFLVGATDIGGLWFYKLLGIVAIVLGVLNIKDAIWYGGGGFLMEVPKSWRPKMIALIKGVAPEEEKKGKECKGCEIIQKPGVERYVGRKIWISYVTISSFLVGLVVSFFLTPCTAGPYFVAGGILSNIPLLEALPYLLFYLLIFISPMVAITLIAYFGFMAIEDVSGWRERNLKTLHWVAGLLLLGLGLAMVFGFI